MAPPSISAGSMAFVTVPGSYVYRTSSSSARHCRYWCTILLLTVLLRPGLQGFSFAGNLLKLAYGWNNVLPVFSIGNTFGISVPSLLSHKYRSASEEDGEDEAVRRQWRWFPLGSSSPRSASLAGITTAC